MSSYKKLLPISLMMLPLSMTAQSGRFTCATMNVDGLPTSIDIKVNYLIYKYEGSINTNPRSTGAVGTTAMAEKMADLNVDFLAVTEDFNYHSHLLAPFTSKGYVGSTHTGEVSLEAAGATTNAQMIKLLNKYENGLNFLTADGLNLISYKTPSEAGWPATTVSDETIVKWDEAYGYDEDYHEYDGITTKGFRYYKVTTGNHGNKCDIDVYMLQFDSGCGWHDNDKGDLDAREKQMEQLVKYINTKRTNDINNRVRLRPIIIMGDFNSYYTRDKLKENLIDKLNALDCWVESACGGVYPEYSFDANDVTQDHREYYTKYYSTIDEPLDKIIYINNSLAPFQLVLERFEVRKDFVDTDGSQLSQTNIRVLNDTEEPAHYIAHYPVVAQFAFYKTRSPVTVGTLSHTVDDAQRGRARQIDVENEANRVLEKK